jgi:predicted Na+-dependent transporter
VQVSLGYLIQVAVAVGNHAQEGLFFTRRHMWIAIAVYAWAALGLRILYQIPGWHALDDTDSIAVRREGGKHMTQKQSGGGMALTYLSSAALRWGKVRGSIRVQDTCRPSDCPRTVKLIQLLP